MDTQNGPNDNDAFFALSPPENLFSQCPRFNILVLGNPESTKIELFSKVFGVDLEKLRVASAFDTAQPIDHPLDINGQNDRLALFTSPNFGTGNEEAYGHVQTFIQQHHTSSEVADQIHCIWYCVASEPDRAIDKLETKFFRSLDSLAGPTPVVLVFTKYDEFISDVRLRWSRDAQERGLSKVAVSHILRDLATKQFEETVGHKWDALASRATVPRVCVATDDDGSFERLAATTLAIVRDQEVKTTFASAQKNVAAISTQVCAEIASEYFRVDTGHARKVHGIEIRDILPNFFAKTAQVFNLRDDQRVLDDPSLLKKVLEAIFDSDQLPFLDDTLSVTDPGILNNLTPHERSCLLAQALAGIILFFHILADGQWPSRESSFGHLREGTIEKVLHDIRSGQERKEALESIEASPVFTHCRLRSEVSDLILKAIENMDRQDRPRGDRIVVEDDSELEEISLSFVNDKSPDDVVLPNGLRILPLN